jgi:ATP-dependent helicase HrpA
MRGKTAEPNFLFVSETDLMGDQDVSYDAEAFPDVVDLDGQKVSLSYAYQPGEDRDGVTLKLPASLARDVATAKVEWAVPGLRESQIAELLRALPKTIRRELMPFAPKVALIARELQPTGNSLLEDLSKFIREHFGVQVPVSAWPADSLPNHLRPRIEIMGRSNHPTLAGRDLDQLRTQLETIVVKPAGDPPQWHQAVQKWEKFDLNSWSIGDLPERILVCDTSTGPLYAWPGLQIDGQHVNLRLFRSQSEARQPTLTGLQRLLEIELQKDLAWLQKDLRSLSRLQPLLAGLVSLEDMQADAFENLKTHLLPAELPTILSAAQFQAALQLARSRLPGLADRLINSLNSVLNFRAEFLRKYPVPKVTPVAGKLNDLRRLSVAPVAPFRPNPLHVELESLMPARFLQIVSFERLNHLSRHLKALLVRAERAALNPVKDRERAAQLVPYLQAASSLGPAKSPEARAAIQEFRWMLEEYKVSLFAQELGTAFPVSPKRLDQQLEKIRSLT